MDEEYILSLADRVASCEYVARHARRKREHYYATMRRRYKERYANDPEYRAERQATGRAYAQKRKALGGKGKSVWGRWDVADMLGVSRKLACLCSFGEFYLTSYRITLISIALDRFLLHPILRTDPNGYRVDEMKAFLSRWWDSSVDDFLLSEESLF
jgi:hypothetical protein